MDFQPFLHHSASANNRVHFRYDTKSLYCKHPKMTLFGHTFAIRRIVALFGSFLYSNPTSRLLVFASDSFVEERSKDGE